MRLIALCKLSQPLRKSNERIGVKELFFFISGSSVIGIYSNMITISNFKLNVKRIFCTFFEIKVTKQNYYKVSYVYERGRLISRFVPRQKIRKVRADLANYASSQTDRSLDRFIPLSGQRKTQICRLNFEENVSLSSLQYDQIHSKRKRILSI